MARRAILDANLDGQVRWIPLDDSTKRERTQLIEQHLISTQLCEETQSRGVAVSNNESLSLMINEEDHLRMQVLLPGYQVSKAFETITTIERRLEKQLSFAFSKRFGYLTACPTNVGTGLRLGVMVHLPALKLTGEMDRLRRASKDLHLAVRGFFGEGSESIGDFYQISNQITLGKSEDELLDEFEHRIVPPLIEYERAARSILLERRLTLLDDRVFRALGLLRAARLISLDEAMKLLSRVRLGVHMNRIRDVDPLVIDQLFLNIQPAHLEITVGESLTKEQKKVARSELIRSALS